MSRISFLKMLMLKLLLLSWWPFDYRAYNISLLLLPWRQAVFWQCHMQQSHWALYKYNHDNTDLYILLFWGFKDKATFSKCLTLNFSHNSCLLIISLCIVWYIWQYLFKKYLKMTFLCVYIWDIKCFRMSLSIIP